MTLWTVDKYYLGDSDEPVYNITPRDLKGYLYCCLKWYGINGLRWCYLSRKQAANKANKLNRMLTNNGSK